MILRKKEPDINDFLRVLKGEKSNHNHLFELFMDRCVYEYFADHELESLSPIDIVRLQIDGSYNAGYDYATTHGGSLEFPTEIKNYSATYSANEGGVIKSWEDFNRYPWPDIQHFDCDHLEKAAEYLPKGMKLGIMGPGGVLENVTGLIGYEDMCYMSIENPDLLQAICDKVGEAFVAYYQAAVKYDTVAFLISNDDWGFKQQTFLSVKDMRKYIFPWHKKIVEVAHSYHKPIILHSCGNLTEVFDDIIQDMQYDAKHSFEDNIVPVEESYEKYADDITILGGLDMDFLIRNDIETIQRRCRNLLEMSKGKGRYMLGTGNSLSYYLPIEKVIAMIRTVIDFEA